MTFGGGVLAGCPIRALVASPHAQAVVRLYAARRVAPLARWPHGYVAWVVRGLIALDVAVTRRREDHRE